MTRIDLLDIKGWKKLLVRCNNNKGLSGPSIPMPERSFSYVNPLFWQLDIQYLDYSGCLTKERRKEGKKLI